MLERLTNKSISIAWLLFGASAVLLAWAALLQTTSGVDVSVLGLRVSSRNPVRPTIVGVVLGLVYVIAFRHHAVALVARAHRIGARLSPSLAIAASVGTLVFGSYFGNFAAGGADAYGYVSQADLWIAQDLVVEQPLATQMPWPAADWTFAPLGYRPAAWTPAAIVPTYAPGLPMMMAVAKVVLSPIASGQCGPYLVGPVLGAVMVWSTYRIGRRLISPLGGFGAAALMASSPGFLQALTTPMSDVPVVGCFTIAIALALSRVRAHAVLTGFAVGVALLVRPNLVLVAGAFVLYFWYRADGWRARFVSVGMFGAGVLPAVVAIALIHTHLYGAPWKSGYGSLSELFAFRFLAVNVERYARWLATMHTPLMFMCVVPFVGWRWVPIERRAPVVLLGSVTTLIWINYLFYLPFETWEYLRFVLTAFPLMIVLALIGIDMVTAWLPHVLRTLSVAALMILVLTVQGDRIYEHGLMIRWKAEAEAFSVSRFVDRALPRNAVVLSMFYSGSVRLYSGRLTLRYDWLDRAWWPRALDVLQEKGYRPYVVLAKWEEQHYHEHFGIPKDVPPGAIVGQFDDSLVRVYDPLAPAAPIGSTMKPVAIPPLMPCPCTERDGERPRTP